MKKRKLIQKWDLLLLLLLLIPCGIWFWRQSCPSDSLTAVIYADGEVLREINLTEVSQAYTVSLPGAPSAVLQVEPGRIRYLEADCKDRLCVGAGWLARPGATAACLPARTMVTLVSGQDGMAMTY